MKYLSVILLLITLNSAAAERISVGFYNLENLYDTIPSLFYDDSDYTPTGKFNWGATRYNKKLHNLAYTIDDMALDIIGVAEVESETSLRDLVVTLNTDYNYIHRSTSDYRGMDVALLYKGDKFIPQTIRQIKTPATRELLYVKGKLRGVRVDIVVCHLPSQLNSYNYRATAIKSLYNFADSLTSHDPEARLIIMGDMNANPTDKVMRQNFHTGKQVLSGANMLFNPLHSMHRNGYGTYVYADRWLMYDNIFISISLLSGDKLRYKSGGIFIKKYLLSSGVSLKRGYPLRTFSGSAYLGGYSDHLPIFIYLEK